TLRTYAAEFAPILSPGARGTPSGPKAEFGHRRYTVSDLGVLKQVKALLDNGVSYRAARSQLGGELETPVRPRRLVRPARSPREAARQTRPPMEDATDRRSPPVPTISAAESPAPASPPLPDPMLLAALEQLSGLAAHLRAV